MESPKTELLCQNVAAAVTDVSQTFRSSFSVSEILDRFWGLQDNLTRVLEAMTDHPEEMHAALAKHPSLLKDVAEVIEFSSKLEAYKYLQALRDASESINSLLGEIQHLRQLRALVATV